MLFSIARSLFFALALLAVAAPVFATPANASFFEDGRRVTLRAGTLILLESTQRIDSRSATIGTIVRFRVMTDVIVDGRTVIASGTQALGRITSIEPGTYNAPEVIQVEVKYVQSVDGQQVNLSTNPLDVSATFTGEGAVINVGTNITSHVMNDIEIESN
ncbi:MAG: hypothetical protein KDC54_22485 [Lewinella sp.]|nr:hypothetical protein [Lewinella sp.]